MIIRTTEINNNSKNNYGKNLKKYCKVLTITLIMTMIIIIK